MLFQMTRRDGHDVRLRFREHLPVIGVTFLELEFPLRFVEAGGIGIAPPQQALLPAGRNQTVSRP